MTPTSIRRRLAIVATALAALGGAAVVTAGDASADPAPRAGDHVRGRRLLGVLAVQHVNIGACLANPLPDLGS